MNGSIPNLQPGRRAFTLMETLIAIAIVLSLAAMLVPAVGKMRDKAAMATDLSNLRQVGQGISAFALEHDGRIPNISIPPPDNGTKVIFCEYVDRMLPPDSQYWRGNNYNYLRRPIWFSKSYAKFPGAEAWGMSSFLWNQTATPFSAAAPFTGYINRAPNLSKLVIVGEKNRGGNEFDPRKAPTYEKDAESYYRISRDGKAYYLFGDYHIELIEGDQSVIAHPEYKSYSPDNRLYYAW